MSRSPSGRWSVVCASPAGESGNQWGDTWFARDLVDALNRAGKPAQVIFRDQEHAPERMTDEVVIVLRGLRRIRPQRRRWRQSPTWVLWVISHPEMVTHSEIDEYDLAFAASTTWGGPEVRPLLQATNVHRFTTRPDIADTGEPVLFVGSTRGQFRPIIRDAIVAGIRPAVYGVGWEEFISPELHRAAFLPNERLPTAYASAHLVLNDHWQAMADNGFLSNRLFDAVACGARVISDPAQGLTEVFGEAVAQYSSPAELASLVANKDLVFGTTQQRIQRAQDLSQRHSFDARARELITVVEQWQRS